jgi:hypothetical protein
MVDWEEALHLVASSRRLVKLVIFIRGEDGSKPMAT